jgi:hypothetical protein
VPGIPMNTNQSRTGTAENRRPNSGGGAVNVCKVIHCWPVPQIPFFSCATGN